MKNGPGGATKKMQPIRSMQTTSTNLVNMVEVDVQHRNVAIDLCGGENNTETSRGLLNLYACNPLELSLIHI